MKQLRIRFPIWVSVGLIVLFVLASLLGSVPALLWPGIAAYSMFLAELTGELTALLVLALAALALGMGDSLRPKGGPLGKKLLPCLALILLYTYNMLATVILCMEFPLQSPLRILWFVLCMLAVGVTEELLFRGLITRMIFEKYGKDTLGVWFSVLISSLLFGAFHLANLTAGVPLSGVLVQAGAAACMGIALGAIYLRTGSFWTVALLHGYMDFCALISSGVFGVDTFEDLVGSYSLGNLIAGLGYGVLGAILLRPSKMRGLTRGGGESSTRELVQLMAVVMLFAGILTAAAVLAV